MPTRIAGTWSISSTLDGPLASRSGVLAIVGLASSDVAALTQTGICRQACRLVFFVVLG